MNFKLPSIVRCALILLASTMLMGCESFTSRVLHRQPNDSMARQCYPKKTKGVPVKLKVPSHVEVSIRETYFMVPENEESDKPDSGPKIQVLQSVTGNRVLRVETETIYTDKVFTIDFPRPVAGTLDLGSEEGDGLQFDSENYLKKISGDITDNTLSTIGTGLTSLAGPDGGANEPVEGDSMSAVKAKLFKKADYEEFTRIIAFQRFDIAEQGWEEQMHAFVEQHLGQCNPPCATASNGGVVIAQPQNLNYECNE